MFGLYIINIFYFNYINILRFSIKVFITNHIINEVMLIIGYQKGGNVGTSSSVDLRTLAIVTHSEGYLWLLA